MDACLAVGSERDQRRYVERPVSPDGVSWILDAGGIAGSAKNGQPRRSLLLGNRGFVYQVPQTVCASPNVLDGPAGDRSCVSGKGPVAFDPGRAAQNMMLAAGNEGVVSCPNGIASPDSLAGPFGTRGEMSGYSSCSRSAIRRARDPEARPPGGRLRRADRGPFEVVARHL